MTVLNAVLLKFSKRFPLGIFVSHIAVKYSSDPIRCFLHILYIRGKKVSCCLFHTVRYVILSGKYKYACSGIILCNRSADSISLIF